MTATSTWHSCTTVRAAPEHVIETLTDPDACARWSPIPFSLDRGDGVRLRAGTSTRVCGRFLGRHVGFNVHTVTADHSGLHIRARGPIEIVVHYTLERVRTGCAVDARVSIPPPTSRSGRFVARATALLLAAGALDHAVHRMAHEAERAAETAGGSPAAT
jgi:hypothetical protein